MTIPYACAACGHRMEVPERYLGYILYCAACKQSFTLPAPGQTAAAVPPSGGEPGPEPLAPVSATTPATVPSCCPGCGTTVDPGVAYCSSCTGPATMDVVGLTRRPAAVTLIAVLDLIGGCVWGLAAIAALVLSLENPLLLMLFAVAGAASATAITSGVGLGRLRPWGRVLQIILAAFGLLGFPVGTLASILILVYLFKPEVGVLFSGKDPSALTPQERVQLHHLASASAAPVAASVAAVVLLGVFTTGIVAAIAIPNLLDAMSTGRQKRTMADMRSLATAIEAFAVDNQHCPRGISSTDQLRPLLTPSYIREVPTVDGWGRPLEVRTTNDGSSYEIVSLGSDGQPDARQGGVTQTFTADIVFRDGSFVQYPEGRSVGF